MDRNNKSEGHIALVDASGKYIDGGNFAYLNLKFPKLEKILEDIIEKNEINRLLCQSCEGLGDVWIQRLERSGNFWRIWQEISVKGELMENPSIRFFYEPRNGVIRPVDYRDPYVQLEGSRKTAQLLIASFLTHWLSGVIILAENRNSPGGCEEYPTGEADYYN